MDLPDIPKKGAVPCIVEREVHVVIMALGNVVNNVGVISGQKDAPT
jgi:hypothetical protein